MKNNIGDLVANSMLNVLNSKEHLSLFNKPYKTITKSAGGCGTCGQDISNVDDHECGDMSYTNDSQDSNYTLDEGEGDLDSIDSKKDDFDGMDDDMMSDDNWSLDHDQMMSTAAYSAIKDLLTASAALDAANYGKASELVVKLANLVSRAAKKDKLPAAKKNVKKPAGKKTKMVSSDKNKKMQEAEKPSKNNSAPSSKSKKNEAPTSKTNPSKNATPSSNGKSSKDMSKMSVKEKMEMLRKMKK